MESVIWLSVSLYLFSSIFNLSMALMLFYLRFKGRGGSYTKSQLWALNILAWLFLLNSLIVLARVLSVYFWYTDNIRGHFIVRGLWNCCTIYTASLLLAFGLVYPKPLMEWKKLRVLIIFVLLLGFAVLIYTALNDFEALEWLSPMEKIETIYIVPLFLPIFLWVMAYSHQTSRETRMIYAILIWGFLFVLVTRNLRYILIYIYMDFPFGPTYLIFVALIVIFLIVLFRALWLQRKRWAAPETVHLTLLGIAVLIGVGMWYLHPERYRGASWEWGVIAQYNELLASFLSITFGWVIVRPLLFSYGLLRYRLLGTQVRAERALGFVATIFLSTLTGLVALNLLVPMGQSMAITVALIIGLVLFFPFWKISNILILRLLPPSFFAEDIPIKERRNTYLIGLQTAVVGGRIRDDDDARAILALKQELDISDREHALLMESIIQDEGVSFREKKVEAAFLIHRFGLLVSQYKEKGTMDEDDADIFASMFTAIKDFVDEAMDRGEKGATDAIAYGPSTLVTEKEGNVFLAAVITGPDDIRLRQNMRDALAEINERFGGRLGEDWDGDLDAVRGIEKILSRFAEKVKRTA